MSKFAVFSALASLSVAALGQAPTTKPPAPDRTDMILDLVRDRVTQQDNVWFADGDFPRDIQVQRTLNELFPHDYELATNLGWMLENVEDYASAIQVYIEYREQWPDDPDAYYPEGSLYFREHLYSKVPPILEPSLKLKTRPHPNSYRILALSYEKLGLYDDSLRVFDALLKFDTGDGAAIKNRNRVQKEKDGTLKPKGAK